LAALASLLISSPSERHYARTWYFGFYAFPEVASEGLCSLSTGYPDQTCDPQEMTTSFSAGNGLSSAEAAERLRTFGPNRIARASRVARLKEIVLMFADPMAIMLGAAAAVYFALGQRTEALVLLGALIPVLAIDVILEARSRGALKRLAQAVSPRAAVIRDGLEIEIDTEQIVPGDLMLVSEGRIVHADGWLHTASNLAIDESQLTGEAEPQAKEPSKSGNAALDGDEATRVYAGSRVIAGHGWAEVSATGPSTSYGNLAQLISEAKVRQTPLQQKTARLVRWLAAIAILVSASLFLLWVARGEEPAHAFLFAVSLAMSAVSEEFLIVLTIFLSLGAWRLSQHGVLVKRLASVETLGATTVICLDKTGTLTRGDFTLAFVQAAAGKISESALLEIAMLACEPDPADSIDRTIIAYCAGHGIDVPAVQRRWQLIRDHPFDPIGKHMSHVWSCHHDDTGRTIQRVVAKGALEGVLAHCSITSDERARVHEANRALASQGARVLALAGRESPVTNAAGAGSREQDEAGLELYGLLGFLDPLRREVPAAVATCQRAGVRLKLITGDHALTAHAIADASGLRHADDGMITGDQLESLAPEQFDEAVERCSIFARVRPEQKYAIVDALERAGEIVAMTGDGVNDAPAMRRADIAVSMGRRATEVARSVADLVLLEDDFTAMAATIREGREIYSNIGHAFSYLAGFKLMLVLTALAVPLANLPILLLPVNLVWLELIVHPVSALVFEGRHSSFDPMLEPPHHPKASLINRAAAVRAAASGTLLAAATVLWYWHRLPAGEDYARAAAMAIVILGSLAMAWAEYAGGRAWGTVQIPRDARFWVVMGCVALSLPIFMFVGPIASLLKISPISMTDWAIAIGVAVVVIGWHTAGTSVQKRAA
jgi:P-type Ca2+ transporter type 2C